MVMNVRASSRWLGLLGAALIVSAAAASSSSSCQGEYYADGDCDPSNNNAECGYDWGDCCSCTCVSTEEYTCGENGGFACVDPEAACVNDDDITIDFVENCRNERIGNGHCDYSNNNAFCGYDGGDCCACTCQVDEDGEGCDEDFACIDPAAACVNDDDITIDVVEACGDIGRLGDGYCDHENNNEICGYDGGDCCSCTCQVDEDGYGCSGYEVFECIDPSATCVDDDDVTVIMVENCGYIGGIGNGRCDYNNNYEACGYDGGDCCSCTCEVGSSGYGCYDFACIDPSAPCVDDDDITVDVAENCDDLYSVGDGWCDDHNNNPTCGYDGGDCCSCTCEEIEDDDGFADDDYQRCGARGFACIDPAAPCVNDDDITTDIVENCDEVSVGNGYCDERNNIPECNYDGGDCCVCTCVSGPNRECGDDADGYSCIDPSAECVNDDDITVDMFDNCDSVRLIGNGYCNVANNTPECNYDGGDCCACTCEPIDDYDCTSFACIDPMAECVDDDSVTEEMLAICDATDIGDGHCDNDNNREECAWDGGDCCECTCLPGDDPDYNYCDEFACIDPSAACFNDDDITEDMLENCGDVRDIGDGHCDIDNNKPECNYDGGDCCECTCQIQGSADDEWGGRWSGCNEFACIDPSAACVDDDPITVDMLEACSDVLDIGDGRCDADMNNAACAYDGGDCCECTCENAWGDDYACSVDGAGFDCQDPSAPCLGEEPTLSYEFVSWGYDDDHAMSYDLFPSGGDDDDSSGTSISGQQEAHVPTLDNAVEVGTKTEVGVSATAYDTRAGTSNGEVGCGEVGGDGCAPQNTRDGVSSDIESRWSCSPKLLGDSGLCQIEYNFAEPQDIVDIQVAFWQGGERTRTLKVYLNGEETHMHESYSGSTFNTLNVAAAGIGTVMLEAVELDLDEWISLVEVLIFVAP